MLAGRSLLIPGRLHAQSVGGAQIGGVIADPSGALVPAHKESHADRYGPSPNHREYAERILWLPNLAVGPYSLK